MITFVYANRNRDLERIRLSMDSLNSQKVKNFSVSFVDYGSDSAYSAELEILLSKYSFVSFYRLNVSHLLWNKSKALNYGICQVSSPYIFIADVDLLFNPETTKQLEENCNLESFALYNLNYISKEDSANLISENPVKDIPVQRKGDVNGMILAPKEAFLKVNGYDEFFHFYGAEDVDLFDRMERAGYKRKKYNQNLFYHYWHPSFQGSDDKFITRIPRVKNIMRINEQHYLTNNEFKIVRPRRQLEIGSKTWKEQGDLLKTPDKTFHIKNILAQVEHFINEVMLAEEGVICAIFEEDPYYSSIKHQVKKLLKKQTQVYIPMKEVNDMILKKIVFEYRNANYSFKIAEDLKSIDFRIQL